LIFRSLEKLFALHNSYESSDQAANYGSLEKIQQVDQAIRVALGLD